MNIRVLPLFLTFFLMGIADAMGPLSSAVASSPFMAALMPFFVFIAFAVFSVPGGILAARIGKQKLLVLGLVLCTVALGVPTFFDPPFPFLLAAIFLLGVGTTFLQVAGNPIMRDISREGDYSRNLSLAQGIKGVGSAVSSYFVTAVTTITFFAAMGWRGAFPVFFVLMGIALISVTLLKIKETQAEIPPGVLMSLELLKEPEVALSVIGIFLYVGAEVCMATFLKPVLISFQFSEKSAAVLGPSMFFGALTVGRLIAGSVKLDPYRAFKLSALAGQISLIALVSGVKVLLIPSILMAGLGFANIWPMLFSITVEEKPGRSSELSGLMCMAISGGAVVPLLMGGLGGGERALPFIVPALCFTYLTFLAVKKVGRREMAK